MKNIKWKSLITGLIVCLLPILFGLALWNDLPEKMAIHFNINNEADNFSSKGFAVIGLPLILAVLHIFNCISTDVTFSMYTRVKNITKWIIPFVSVFVQVMILGYNIGWKFDVAKSAMIVVGAIFIVTGVAISKLDFVKKYNVSPEKARKINKFTGIGMIVMGVLAVITIFLPSASLLVWLYMLIPYTVACVIYGYKVRKSDGK